MAAVFGGDELRAGMGKSGSVLADFLARGWRPEDLRVIGRRQCQSD